MKVNLIVFDFDGTLFDSSKDLTEAMNFALKKVDLPPVSREKVWSFTGDGTRLLIKRVLGEENESLYDKVFTYFMSYYSLHYADYTRPLDGVKYLIERLKRKKMAILSNKYKKFVDKILDKFGMKKYFLAIYGKDSFSKSKPDPYPLLYIMNELQVAKERTIFVGDSLNDILISQNTNIKCFIVPSGVTPMEKIKALKPFEILKNIKELENFVK